MDPLALLADSSLGFALRAFRVVFAAIGNRPETPGLKGSGALACRPISEGSGSVPIKMLKQAILRIYRPLVAMVFASSAVFSSSQSAPPQCAATPSRWG